MMSRYLPVVGALAAIANATSQYDKFAVLRFNTATDANGNSKWLVQDRMDPITNPGAAAPHAHNVMGGNAFSTTLNGDDLLKSTCTTSKIKNDKSAYWTPQLYFQDPKDGSFEIVPLNYMNVYYFFEQTQDEGGVQPFPPGLKILSGNKDLRTPPTRNGAATGQYNLDPSQGPINNAQITCPQADGKTENVYMPGSDGMHAGVMDASNPAKNAGSGFPVADCDGYASPMRLDIHMPSCYRLGPNRDVTTHLNDFENNMKFPTTNWSEGGVDCGDADEWMHVPHMFYEVYYNTPEFKDRWTRDGKNQPFVLSNGDATAYSFHADFVAGWEQETLAWIIKNCNAGTLGMDTCQGIPGGLSNDMDCTVEPMIDTGDVGISSLKGVISNVLSALPGANKVTGWGKGGVDSNIVETEEEPETTKAAAKPTAEKEAAPKPTTTSTTAAPDTPTGGAFVEAQDVESMETVWDVVTVTETATAWAEETGAARRRHNHAARHAHHRN